MASGGMDGGAILAVGLRARAGWDEISSPMVVWLFDGRGGRAPQPSDLDQFPIVPAVTPTCLAIVVAGKPVSRHSRNASARLTWSAGGGMSGMFLR